MHILSHIPVIPIFDQLGFFHDNLAEAKNLQINRKYVMLMRITFSKVEPGLSAFIPLPYLPSSPSLFLKPQCLNRKNSQKKKNFPYVLWIWIRQGKS